VAAAGAVLFAAALPAKANGYGDPLDAMQDAK
jgi:hypothetical protein